MTRLGLPLAILSSLVLSSCSVPETVVEETTATMDEIGKERKIGQDIEITPAEQDKVKVRF